MINNYLKHLLLILFATLFFSSASADSPITLYDSYAGNVNLINAQNKYFMHFNPVKRNVLLGKNTVSNSGISTGTKIKASHKYWSGSYSAQTG